MSGPAADGPAPSYGGWVEAARRARADLFEGRGDLDPIDLEDAATFLAALLEGSLQFLHGDPARPAFIPWVTPTRRWMDNGRDSLYSIAAVDGDHRYRITGRRGDECYLSLTLYAGDPGHPQRVVTNVNHRDLAVGHGDEYALELDPPEDACYVIRRQYLHQPLTEIPGTTGIEVVAGTDGSASGPHPPGATEAQRWQAATGFLTAMTRRPASGGSPPPWVSTTANEMGDPSRWDPSHGGGRGTPDQVYAMGPYDLGQDEALVMDVRFPECAYASVALWNRFSQTVDARFHRSTVNHREAVPSPDGNVRIVVAHGDPGTPNWLDAGGRKRGSVFWRFLLAEHPPPPIESRVAGLDEVRAAGRPGAH